MAGTNPSDLHLRLPGDGDVEGDEELRLGDGDFSVRGVALVLPLSVTTSGLVAGEEDHSEASTATTSASKMAE